MARMSNQAKRDKLASNASQRPRTLARQREALNALRLPGSAPSTFHRFLQLPKELRDEIYRLHFGWRSPCALEWRWNRTAILSTSSVVHQEATKVLHELDWSTLDLVVHHWPELPDPDNLDDVDEWHRLEVMENITSEQTWLNNLGKTTPRFNLGKVYAPDDSYLYAFRGRPLPDSAIAFAQTLFLRLDYLHSTLDRWGPSTAYTAETMLELYAQAQALRTICFSTLMTHGGPEPEEESHVRFSLDLLLSKSTVRSICIMAMSHYPVNTFHEHLCDLVRDVLRSKSIDYTEEAHSPCITMAGGSKAVWDAYMFDDSDIGYEFCLKR